jgi:molybdopterin/thiamine biosynthesis adenylyltransferase
MFRIPTKTLIKWVFVITTIILSAIVSVILIVPTECVNSCNTQYAERRLLSDLSISNQIDFVAGRFRRESLIVYRLLSSDFPTSKFSNVRTEALKRDYVKRLSESARSCNVNFTPSMNDHFLVFYGSDYSVVYVKSKPQSYMFFFGAQ